MIIGIIYSLVEEVVQGFEADKAADNEIIHTLDLFKRALEPNHRVIPIRVRLKDFFSLSFKGFDFIFNLCESIEGNPEGEALIAAYIENQGVPFSGSNHLTLGICLNKVRTKQLLLANGLKTPLYQVFETSDETLEPEMDFPLIVKPMKTDASIGISMDSVVENEIDLKNKIQFINNHYNQPALVEEYIDGRELNLAIIGNGKTAQCLPISEIIFNLPEGTPRILDFESKWVETSQHYQNTKGICPAILSPEEERALTEAALEAYEIMGCRDYARVDVRLRDGSPFILEVNPNPGINVDSGFYRSIKTTGIDYEGMVLKLCDIALGRYSLELQKSMQRQPYFSSERLTFYRVEITDIKLLQKWFSRVEIKQFMDEPHTPESEESLIRSYFLSNESDYYFMVQKTKTLSWIGYCAIYNISQWNRTGEISFLVGDRESIHKGYGKEIISALELLAFKKLGLNRLLATVTVDNLASIAIFKQSHFRLVGTLQEAHFLENQKIDDMLFELVRGKKRNQAN